MQIQRVCVSVYVCRGKWCYTVYGSPHRAFGCSSESMMVCRCERYKYGNVEVSSKHKMLWDMTCGVGSILAWNGRLQLLGVLSRRCGEMVNGSSHMHFRDASED
jgi:hypothetical protein